MNSSLIRAFIAIELPEKIKNELDNFQEKLNLKKEPAIKCVAADAIHLTLKFLGEIPVDKIEEINTAMRAVTQNIKTFQLELKGLGCFPGVQQPRVIWVGLGGEENLQFLQKRLDAALEKLGFASEKRPFTAHLTLARVRENCPPTERHRLGERVHGLDYQRGLKFTADHISLIRSILKPQGPEYTVLHRANFIQ